MSRQLQIADLKIGMLIYGYGFCDEEKLRVEFVAADWAIARDELYGRPHLIEPADFIREWAEPDRD